MIVASNESTRLPQEWQWTGATHRKYTLKEINMWRARARNQTLATDEEQPKVSKMKRWPHQVSCAKACRSFLKSSSLSKRDFFVQMATGTGKSLVMADLLAELGPNQRACVIVPKLDLMEQMARLLEETLHGRKVCRVGTGWPADLTSEVFVCVRNSAWQLQRLSFDMVILDEAHHYEPMLRAPNWSQSDADVAADNLTNDELLGVHAKQVLALQTRKRVFFSATLIQNEPDFDFDLRPAIQAGVIMDYTVMVPLVSEGDLRPALVKVIHNLPLARKILAFCNTVREAQSFAHMLNDAGIPADHYNAKTVAGHRQDILRSFRRSQAHGGIRVLVTVDVLSEGVDLPVADTCLFVAPRKGVRLRQCVGRVLRKHPGKVDALVIAPPIVQKSDGSLAEETELKRLLSELAMADPCFRDSLIANDGEKQDRVGILAGRMQGNELHEELANEAASLLGMRVFPHVLEACSASFAWEAALQELARYKVEHGNVKVKFQFVTDTGIKLGQWVSARRRDRSKGKLSAEQIASLDELGFVWDVLDQMWQQGLEQLKQYRAEHGHVLVPKRFQAADGFKLGSWVSSRRKARSKGKLSTEQIASLDEFGFLWKFWDQMWQHGLGQLKQYRAKHGHVLVPKRFQAADGFQLGSWVSSRRKARSKGRLSTEQIANLDGLGFVWDFWDQMWQQGLGQLKQYRAVHGHVLVPNRFEAADGFKLGSWVSSRRKHKSKGRLSTEQIANLDELGFVWDVCDQMWQQGLGQLKQYRAEHGHVLVPSSYAVADDFKLGSWVSSRRKDRSKGKLSTEQIANLDELGFVWDVFDQMWQQGLGQLKQYRAVYGHVLVPSSYAAADGFKLGSWVSNRRTDVSKGKLSTEQIANLDELGFVWHVFDQKWQQRLGQLKQYRAEHGHVLVPSSYAAADGFKLGSWVSSRRKSKGRLSTEQVASLDELGFVWDVFDQMWQQGLGQLKQYRAEHGHVLVLKRFEAADGFQLGLWVSNKRKDRSQGQLSTEQIASLDELGFVWDVWGQMWQQGLGQLKQYRAEHGHVLVPSSYAAADGFKLGSWVSSRRTDVSKGRLSTEQIGSLGELGFVWDVFDQMWQQGLGQLKLYRAVHGHVLVPNRFEAADGFKLGSWVSNRRKDRSKGKLSAKQTASLDGLGFVWDFWDQMWQQGLGQLKQYRAGHGHVLVPRKFQAADGFKLGSWVSRRRKDRSMGKLSTANCQFGRAWICVGFWDQVWQHGLGQLKQYRAEHGHVLVPSSYAAADGFKLGSWVSSRRKDRSKGKLIAEQTASLDELGLAWRNTVPMWLSISFQANKSGIGWPDVLRLVASGNKVRAKLRSQRTFARSPLFECATCAFVYV